MPSPAIISGLLGHGQMGMGVECYGSLVRSCPGARLRIHEDGTLTEEDKRALRDALPVDEIIGRSEADAWAESFLRKHPRCLAFRRSAPFAIKMFDIPFLRQPASARFCDSDVLFLRATSGLADPTEGRGTFMHDCQNAYAVRPWHLWGRHALCLAERLNSGLFVLDPRIIDLDLWERILSIPCPRFQRLPGWVEQTCWAGLPLDKLRLWPSKQIQVPPGRLDGTPAAVHLTSPMRGLFPQARGRMDFRQPGITLVTEPARRLRWDRYAWSEALRIARNLPARLRCFAT